MGTKNQSKLSSMDVFKENREVVICSTAVFITCMILVVHLSATPYAGTLSTMLMATAFIAIMVLASVLAESLEGDKTSPIIRASKLGFLVARFACVAMVLLLYPVTNNLLPSDSAPLVILYGSFFGVFTIVFVLYRFKKRFFQWHAEMSFQKRLVVFLPPTAVLSILMVLVSIPVLA